METEEKTLTGLYKQGKITPNYYYIKENFGEETKITVSWLDEDVYSSVTAVICRVPTFEEYANYLLATSAYGELKDKIKKSVEAHHF